MTILSSCELWAASYELMAVTHNTSLIALSFVAV